MSTTSFADCDVNLLHHLTNKYDITYGVVIPSKNANYSAAQLTNYCMCHNINVSLFHTKYRYRDPRILLIYIKILFNIFKVKPDVIYINNFDQIYFNMLMTVIKRKGTIIAIHDVVNHSGTSFDFLATFSRNILLNKFNNFLTFSQSQADILKKMRPNHHVNVIPLALKDFGTLTKSAKDEKKVNFLFFGNIKPYKGLDILLKSVNRLSRKYPSFTLTIAGRCPNWDEVYEPLIENENIIIKNVRFIDNDEIPSFFSKADYLILPYKDATQSGPLMIAYNYTVPVIASDIVGFREFIDNGRTGYLFDQNSDDAIDTVLEEALLRSQQEYDVLLNNVSIFARQKLSIERTVSAYNNLFQQVINGN